MPDESTPTSPGSPPPYDPRRRVGTGLAGETTRNEGSTILPEDRQRSMEVLGDFEIMAKLGQGGMGAVYRARQISLDRQVALKILPANFETDPDYVSRFQREARVAASLSHANLVKVYSSGVTDGCHYIAMELIEGETLGQWVRRGAVPPLEALRITLDVARALECGWRTAQLIHRDIKPGNIFLSIHGDVRLGDLGLAKIVGADSTGLTHTGAAMGTPHYISPEQARGDRDLDFRTDIYSLGCTLYQMLTGRTPYSGSDPVVVLNHHLNSPPPAVLKAMPECPLPLARLVSKMLKKQRRERFASYEELIAAIESVRVQLDPSLSIPTLAAASPPEPVTPAPPLPPASAAPRQSRLPIYGGIAIVVLAAAAFFLWPREEKLTSAERYAHEHAADLKAAAEAGIRPPDATKDAPFVNTLGMKFVPVPIIGGPTSGQRVLFSLWDTRVQDYDVFAKETKRDWPKPGFAQGSSHPAVMVSWNDAKAFCAWLTEREGKAGKLSANEVYRLPTDHEWSCAVGIGDWEDAAKLPEEKSKIVADIYPWGTQWPPPEKAGNYASEELRPLLAAGMYASWISGVLPGYYDGYAETSPVGSFNVNKFGLYDIGGNVWQWCEDRYDKAEDTRVLRAAAWSNSDRLNLLSSYRNHMLPASRGNNNGFRCVLASATAPTPPTAGLTPVAEAWQDVLHDPTQIGLNGGAERTPEGLSIPDGGSAMRHNDQGPHRDGAVRLRTTFGGLRPQLMGRSVGSVGTYQLSADRGGMTIVLRRFDSGANQNPVLREFPLRDPLRPGREYELELRIVGQTLTTKLNGEVLGTVTDDTYAQGHFGVGVYDRNGSPALINALEVLDLGPPSGATVPPASTTPTAAGLSPSAEPWEDVVHDPTKLVLSDGAERTPEGLRFADAGGAILARGPNTKRQGALRFLATFGGLNPELFANGTACSYRVFATADGKKVDLVRYDTAARTNTPLREFSLSKPLQLGQEYELELRLGQNVMVKLNGEALGTIADAASARRYEFGAIVRTHNASPTLVKALEVLDVEADSSTVSAPAGKP